jgi:hypothetical protein
MVFGRIIDVRTSVPCIGTLSKVAFERKDGSQSLHKERRDPT